MVRAAEVEPGEARAAPFMGVSRDIDGQGTQKPSHNNTRHSRTAALYSFMVH